MTFPSAYSSLDLIENHLDIGTNCECSLLLIDTWVT